MSWAIGFDSSRNRYIGYGVPAYCDQPKCSEVINRGLSYVCCSQQPYGGEKGCGMFFCSKHSDGRHRCSPCNHGRKPYKVKPDHPKWMRHQLRDPSWAAWRKENPQVVAAIREALRAQP